MTETTFDAQALQATLKELKSDPQIANQMVVHGDVVDDAILKTVANDLIPAMPKRKLPQLPKKGMTIKFVNLMLPFVENFWVERKRYPSTDVLIQEFGISREEVLFINTSVMWLKCLDRRGIRRPNVDEDFLSPRQQAALSLVTNYHDKRHKELKLAALGVSLEEFNGWMHDPAFKSAINARSDDVLNNVGVDAN